MLLGVALPALATSAFPFDMVEGFLWGRSFELGYHKHPPLQAWLLGGLERVVPDGWRWLAFGFAQACVAISIVAIWRLSRVFLPPALAALVALFTLAGLNAYTSPTQTFTPDTLTLPLWALTLLFYWRAVGEGSRAAWFGLALTATGFVYGKYVGALLFAVLAVFTLATRQGRAALRAKEPWIAMLLAALLCLPHILWLAKADASALAYPLVDPDRRPANDAVESVWFAFKFLIAQIMNHIGLMILMAVCVIPQSRGETSALIAERPPLKGFAGSFIVTVTLVPLAVVLLFNMAAGVEFRHAWTSPFFAASALGLMLLLGPTVRLARPGAAMSLALVLIVAQHVLPVAIARLGTGTAATTYPTRDLADALTQRFHDSTGETLRVVVGERRYAGNVAFSSVDRPFLYIDGSRRAAPWITPDLLARHSVLLVWPASDGEAAPAAQVGPYAGTVAQGQVSAAWQNRSGEPVVRLNYAIVKPGT
jgi:4-amino-4-deoxy-L-arabinose transferase-like glycosyltransferase